MDAGRYPPGTVLGGRHRIVSLIGQGGMGEVYLAEDLLLDERVALKFLPLDALERPELRARFVSEVRLARRVTHPNVARVHDIGEADGRPFLSMEYVDGEDLRQLLRRIGRLPEEKGVEIARQISEGLFAAHQRGILHRDLKPANVMLDGRGRVRLTDFGLARLTRGGGDGRVVGTPAYMSPEQIAGGEVGTASDLYSLGLLLYELFTGRRPFQGDSLTDYLRLHQHEIPARPSSVVDQLDPAIERVILQCLDKQPDRRPTSARAVTLALPGGDPLAAALAAGETPAPELVAAAGEREAPRRRTVIALLAAIAVLGVLAVLLGERAREQQGVQLGKSPVVLTDRAREVLAIAGLGAEPAEEGSWYELERSPPDEGAASTGDSARLALRFHHRRADGPLLHQGRWLQRDDPAPVAPGMAHVVLDETGRLMQLEVVPPDPVSGGGPVPTATWTALLEEAGLLPGALTDASASRTPPVASDERLAWRSSSGADHTTVEAAGQDGRPVWWIQARGTALPARTAASASSSAFAAFQLAIIAAGALAAWVNLRRGRGDLRGARRVGLFSMATHLVWVLAAMHAPSTLAAWTAVFLDGAAYATWIGLLACLYYLALEPFVRRRWPTLLISWTRLIIGRRADPLVGRDVLVGLTAGLLIACLVSGAPLLARAAGAATGSTGTGTSLLCLLGAGRSLGTAVHVAGDAVLYALVWVIVLAGLRTLVRSTRWAGVLWTLLMTGAVVQFEATSAVLLVSAALAVLVSLLVLLRWGLLAAALALFGWLLFTTFQPVSDLSSWAAHETLVIVLAIGGLAAWGARAALNGRTLLPREA